MHEEEEGEEGEEDRKRERERLRSSVEEAHSVFKATRVSVKTDN